MKIVDNFLNSEDFFFVKESILGPRMYWLYEDHKVSKNDNELQATQFYHMFCEFYKASNLIYMVEPIFKKLNIIALYRIKANLEPYKGNQKYCSDFHYDFTSPNTGKPNKEMKTGIFYLNTNNGYTEFEDGTIVESIENRFVEFSSDTLHRGVSSTDVKKRIVLNFNYFSDVKEIGG